MRTIVDRDEKHAHFTDYAVTMSDGMVCSTNRRPAQEKAKPRLGNLFDRRRSYNTVSLIKIGVLSDMSRAYA